MQSFLIVSKDTKIAFDHAISICKKNRIESIDIDIHSFDKKVGIEDVRNLQKKIWLVPLKSKIKAVVLEGHEGLTIEAQNSLLKILEEPPNNTIIILTISSIDELLTTILSRCKIIKLKDTYTLSQKENDQYLSILVSLPQKSVGERLLLAQDITKNKDGAYLWLEKMIIIARQAFIDNKILKDKDIEKKKEKSPNLPDGGSQYFNILISFQKTYTLLKTTNANQRLALENLFLNL